jgi:DNA mismatch endonuclease (patch repair protein)
VSNTDYWHKKLDRTMLRDVRNRQKLRALGWKPVVVWECQLSDMPRVGRGLEAALRERR